MERKILIALAAFGATAIFSGAVVLWYIASPSLKPILATMYTYRGSICPRTRPRTDEEGIKAMKTNVHSTVATSPNAKVVGQVFLTRSIPISKFIDLTTRYQLDADYSNGLLAPSIQFEIPDIQNGIDLRDGTMGWKAVPEFFATSTFETWLEEQNKTMPKIPEIPPLNSENTRIISFTLQGRATDFERLWQDDSAIVRAVGMSCTSLFGTRRPTESLWF
ncbi:MAG: hypothetical protein ABIO72_05195 [Patescibacteria group bacterium]